jgi:UDP-N-acetylmuramate--L-alanine ligase/UDP-N-acetylenolpyruvoylglucosamine reductase
LFDTAGPNATVYLVGAGGCGMSGLGHLLLDAGIRVAGSDLVANDDTRGLQERGAQIHVGHNENQVAAARPALVVYSSAVRLNNEELQAAERWQIPIARRAAALAALVHRQRGICIAGMHGKTTTSALLAFALEKLFANPSYAVGAHVPQLRRHARLSPRTDETGRPPLFVVEADESDGTLREFRPAFSIVLNVDEEHLDYYANLDAVCREFAEFARHTTGQLIFCADDPALAEIFARHPGALSYGFHPLATYRLASRPGDAAEAHSAQPAVRIARAFEVWHQGEKLGDFAVRLLGEKNMSNAGAVVALLHRLGYGAKEIAHAIGQFTGAARRQEELFRDSRFCVFDDYGHHPAEIRATLRALKSHGSRRLLVAFQPHRYTRTQALLGQFATCFGDADKLWVTEIYAANEPEIPGLNGARFAEAIRGAGQPVELVATLADLPRAVRAAMLPGDTVLFIGAGDITKAAHKLAGELREEPMSSNEKLFGDLTAALSTEAVVRRDEPLAKRTTLRVGGKADYYVEPASEEDLSRLLGFCAERQLKFTLLGRGSNLLVRDGGIRGVVLCLCQPKFSRLEIVGERLHCGAGVKLKAISVEARRAGLTGLEFLEGIPGSLGGAMRMNAGAMGSWLFDVVEKIRFMDYSGRVHERNASEVNVEYRGCPLFRNHVALCAVLKGQPASPAAVAERMQKFSEKRWESQPAASSAGCIFKNPATIPAGKLIDELGLKGTRVGGAVVSDVHGNFIVNEGKATAQDVLNLIEVIKQRARSSRGIELETEVEILGEDPTA